MNFVTIEEEKNYDLANYQSQIKKKQVPPVKTSMQQIAMYLL